MFASIWKPILFCIIFAYLLLFSYLIIVSLRLKVRPSVIFRKILPTYIIGLSTASSMAAFGASMDINEKKLGIPVELNRIGLPLGSILDCPASYTALAGTIIMFCDFFMTACNISIRHLELILQALHWKKLDKEKFSS